MIKEHVFPRKLERCDKVRIVAPSFSMSLVSEETSTIALSRLLQLGLEVSFGAHVFEVDDFDSSSIPSRLEDLHDAFADPTICLVLSAIGGFNCNQLLPFIDWALLRENPKVFCGYSDATVLNNAILAKTGIVSYSGPDYSTFGQKHQADYTLESFINCLMNEGAIDIKPSPNWSDDALYRNEDHREYHINNGLVVINEGDAEGTILGGNLNTFNLLHGSEYMPTLKNSILFLEEDELASAVCFDRDLESILHQPGFEGVNGIVIGRFQRVCKISDSLLVQIIKSKQALNHIPVIAGVDFGHTEPKITFPIGGTIHMYAHGNTATMKIIHH